MVIPVDAVEDHIDGGFPMYAIRTVTTEEMEASAIGKNYGNTYYGSRCYTPALFS